MSISPLGCRRVMSVAATSAVIFTLVIAGLPLEKIYFANVTVPKSAGSTISSNSQSSE